MTDQIKYTDPIVLKVEDVARILSIGRNSAYELVRSGRISSIKVGRVYRIPRAALDDFLDNANGKCG